MKKLIIAAFLLGLMSCEKETVHNDCMCGTVEEVGYQSYELKNICSGNTITIEDTISRKKGEEICLYVYNKGW